MQGPEPIRKLEGCYAKKESIIKNSSSPGLRFDIDGNDSHLRFRSNICCGATTSAAPGRRVSVATLRDLSATGLLPELCLQLPGLFEPVLFVPLYATVLR